jgi:hypothetical protein
MNQGSYNFVNFEGGAGVTSAQEVDELNKALSAGAGYAGAPTSLSGGGVLQVESLDASLKSVTYEMKQIKLWPQMPKDQAYNTIEEYNRIDAYGDQGRGFIAEGALPRSEDSSYSRQIQRVRFIGVTRELTHVYTLVRNAHGDAIAREIRNGTMRILEIVERNLFDGHGMYSNNGLFDGADAALLPESDLSWDGLDKQIRKGNADASAKAKAFTGYGVEEDVIKDLRGLVLDQDALEDGARIVQENFGMASTMMLDTKAHSDLSRQFYPKERINPMGVSNGKSGFVLQSFVASAGEFSLQSDVFLRPKRGAPAPLADAPAAPAVTPAAVAPTVANSKWDAASAGAYSYRASAINAAGEGALGAAAAATVAAAGAIDVAIAATPGAIAYAVYRSPVGATSGHEFVGYVAPASVGGAATLRDLNHRLPGLAQAYLLTMDSEAVRFKQLAPLMKMDLAIVATAYRWMQLLYGTPIVYAPRKHLIFMNIGRST